MRTSDARNGSPPIGARLLVADDDLGVRTMFATLLRATAGVTLVIEAADGAEAVALAGEQRLDIAVLDMNMPRLDGIEAALRLRALQPSLQIALHSSDPDLLHHRARRPRVAAVRQGGLRTLARVGRAPRAGSR